MKRNNTKRKSAGHSVDAQSISSKSMSSNDAAFVSSIATKASRELEIYLKNEKKTKLQKLNKSSKTSKTSKPSKSDQSALPNDQALINKNPAITVKAQPASEKKVKLDCQEEDLEGVDLKEYEMYAKHKRAEASKRQKLSESDQPAPSNNQALANKDPAITAKVQQTSLDERPFFKNIIDAIGLYSELEEQKKQLQKDHDKLCEAHEKLLLRHNTNEVSCTKLTQKNNQLTLSNQALEAKVERLEKNEKALNYQIKQLKQDNIEDTDQLLDFMGNAEQYKEKPTPNLNLQPANAMQNHFGQSQPSLASYHNQAPAMSNTITIQSQPMYAMPNTYAPYLYPMTSHMPSVFYPPHSAQPYNPQVMQQYPAAPSSFTYDSTGQASQSQSSFVSHHSSRGNAVTTQSQMTSLDHVLYSRPPSPMSTLLLSSFSPTSMAFSGSDSRFDLSRQNEVSLSGT